MWRQNDKIHVKIMFFLQHFTKTQNFLQCSKFQKFKFRFRYCVRGCRAWLMGWRKIWRTNFSGTAKWEILQKLCIWTLKTKYLVAKLKMFQRKFLDFELGWVPKLPSRRTCILYAQVVSKSTLENWLLRNY